jgi:hypothetical protein
MRTFRRAFLKTREEEWMSYGRDSPTVCGTGAESAGTPAREHAMKWTKRSLAMEVDEEIAAHLKWTKRSALALLGAVTFLATVAADVGLAVRAVLAEVTHLGTILALHVVHVARLSALLRHVAFIAIATTLLQRLLTVSLARTKERLFSSGDSLSSV